MSWNIWLFAVFWTGQLQPCHESFVCNLVLQVFWSRTLCSCMWLVFWTSVWTLLDQQVVLLLMWHVLLWTWVNIYLCSYEPGSNICSAHGWANYVGCCEPGSIYMYVVILMLFMDEIWALYMYIKYFHSDIVCGWHLSTAYVPNYCFGCTLYMDVACYLLAMVHTYLHRVSVRKRT